MPWLFPPVLTAGQISNRSQPTLNGDHLILRPWCAEDTADVVAAFANPELRHWQGRSLDSEAEACEWVKGRHKRWAAETGASWAITESDTGCLTGQVGLWGIDRRNGCANFSYWVLPKKRCRGIASHAVDQVTRWAFHELGLYRLEIGHAVANTASCRVAEKLDFALEGTKRSASVRADGRHDMHLHARVRQDSQTEGHPNG